jgi:adenosyl cobinamide kinase/adenosyl cobinamide phosphate guanylyltransferase
VEWEDGVVIDCVALAMTNLVLALLGLAAFVARDDARLRSTTCRAESMKRRRPRVVWVTNEVRVPSHLASRRRRGPST